MGSFRDPKHLKEFRQYHDTNTTSLGSHSLIVPTRSQTLSWQVSDCRTHVATCPASNSLYKHKLKLINTFTYTQVHRFAYGGRPENYPKLRRKKPGYIAGDVILRLRVWIFDSFFPFPFRTFSRRSPFSQRPSITTHFSDDPFGVTYDQRKHIPERQHEQPE